MSLAKSALALEAEALLVELGIPDSPDAFVWAVECIMDGGHACPLDAPLAPWQLEAVFTIHNTAELGHDLECGFTLCEALERSTARRRDEQAS